MILPDKIYKKGDIVILNEDSKKWNWYLKNSFRIVSHYLYYKDATKYDFDIYVLENKIDEHEFPEDFRIQRWLVKARCIESGKYYRFAEIFLDYDPIKMRNKKINELIES